MIKWIKPNGREIETGDNDATIKMASSLGWERVYKKEKAKPAKQSKVKVEKGEVSKDGDSGASN